MADVEPVGSIWNWCVAGRIEPGPVRAALSAVLGHPVAALGEDTADAGVLCDVFPVGGDFPTVVDVYLPPAVDEVDCASAVAVRLSAAVLLPDDTLNPTRYVLAEPDGTVRAVHADEVETDDGIERRHVRPCTGDDPACAIAPERKAA